jgi:glucoamylase
VPDPPWLNWRFNHRRTDLVAGKLLRIEVLAPARVRYSTDQWKTSADIDTYDTRLGIHVVHLPTAALTPESHVYFTFYWVQSGR